MSELLRRLIGGPPAEEPETVPSDRHLPSLHPEHELPSWAGHTMEEGAATDETPDPEPWDTDTTEGDTGVMPGTFGPQPLPVHRQPVDVTAGVPVVIVQPVPTRELRAGAWRTARFTVGTTQPVRVAPVRPDRHSLLVTNEDSTNTLRLGPTEASVLSSTESRTVQPQDSWGADMTGEVWALAVGGDTPCQVDETVEG